MSVCLSLIGVRVRERERGTEKRKRFAEIFFFFFVRRDMNLVLKLRGNLSVVSLKREYG